MYLLKSKGQVSESQYWNEITVSQVSKTGKNRRGVFIVLLSLLLVHTYADAYELITKKGVQKVSVNTKQNLGVYKTRVGNPKGNIIATTKGCQLRSKFDSIIDRVSSRYKVDTALVKAVISTESCFNPKAVSPKGAQGLMQLMPNTAKRFGVLNSFDPVQNITGGIKYLRFLLIRYKGDIKLAVAAYNAGEGAVDKYQGVPPYRETQAYVKKVLVMLDKQILDKSVGFKNSTSKIDGYTRTYKCKPGLGELDLSYVYYGGYSTRIKSDKKQANMIKSCDS